ncbi:MAG: NADH-quinone oxidoreductase subunit J [Chloroflexales bacterium]|nr:NADH-quinone oxidoreductase subunit J [Chloroflexales bacterium]
METVVQIIFGLLAALIVGAAVMVVTVRNVIHAALWLIASFFGIGALYMLLEAEFIAVIQVLVYVGAISILILFAIMLTRQVTGEGVRQLTKRWWVSLLVAVALFAAVIVPTVVNHKWNLPALPAVAEGAAPAIEPMSGPAELGRGFVFEYMLQFQVAGVLLTVALIGAIVIAFEERSRRRSVLTLAEEHELRKAATQRRGPRAPAGEPVPAAPIVPVTDGD